MKSSPMNKVKKGKVVKVSAPTTVSVEISEVQSHKKYLKTVVYSKKVMVHDAGCIAKVGDAVIIGQARPISKRKRWFLKEVINQVDLSEGVLQ